MLIGIVSDLHCNVGGLRDALERMGPVDELFCAGDAILQYRFSNEVMEVLRERGARYVLGNHELTFLSPAGARARSAPIIRPENLAYMASRPTRTNVELGGKRLVMVHGSPFPPFDEYVYPSSPTLGRFAEVDADFVIVGHTHYAMAMQVGRTLVINPGSAGDPRDIRNGYALSYAVLDIASGEVRFECYTDPARSWHAPPVDAPSWPAIGVVASTRPLSSDRAVAEA